MNKLEEARTCFMNLKGVMNKQGETLQSWQKILKSTIVLQEIGGGRCRAPAFFFVQALFKVRS